MTKTELIKELEKFPDDDEVFIGMPNGKTAFPIQRVGSEVVGIDMRIYLISKPDTIQAIPQLVPDYCGPPPVPDCDDSGSFLGNDYCEEDVAIMDV